MNVVWIGILGIGMLGFLYTYVGYPLILILVARVFSRAVQKAPITPRVTMFIAAHNEGWILKEKLENSLSFNYPADRFKIVIASDGSKDDTVAIVKSFADRGVILYEFLERRGKVPVINEIMPQLDTDIILFSDAREMYHTDAVKEMMANFNDASVGAVSGELILTADKIEAVGKTIQIYWEYEKRLRKREGDIWASVGATGAIYAIRHTLFKKIPTVTILDDLAIPMTIIEQGYRVVFERGAKAYDEVLTSTGKEYGRKSRTLAGNFQIFFNLGRKYHFNNLLVLFFYFSHKVSRMALPIFLMMIYVGSLFLPSFLGIAFFGVQTLFYILAITGLVGERYEMKHRFIFHMPAVFCTLHFAIVVGFWRYVLHRQRTSWKQLVRGSSNMKGEG